MSEEIKKEEAVEKKAPNKKRTGGKRPQQAQPVNPDMEERVVAVNRVARISCPRTWTGIQMRSEADAL